MHFNISIQPHFMHIILPVGISFYTFQTMSYTIDVYRREMAPTRDVVDFMLFVSFFPQLVAGPIERAKHLLPQITFPRSVTLEKFFDGCYLIYWGLFIKIFIADNLGRYIVNGMFDSAPPYDAMRLLVAIYAFAIQVYCDFDGYSNIARGLGKCMGFDIMINFNLPYFATNPVDFWRRWHISLSSWLRDYVYIPLGGNRFGDLKTYRNIAITMLLGGVWHGAAWTYVVWGIYNSGVLIIYKAMIPFLQKVRMPSNAIALRVWTSAKIIVVFNLMAIGLMIVRAKNISQAYEMLHSLIVNFHFNLHATRIKVLLFYTWLFFIIQYLSYKTKDLEAVQKLPVWVRAVIYIGMYVGLAVYGAKDGQEFIYFQF